MEELDYLKEQIAKGVEYPDAVWAVTREFKLTREEVEMLEEAYMDDCYNEEHSYDDSMDGDFDSAMASAGFGVDESYVADNDYFDDY